MSLRNTARSIALAGICVCGITVALAQQTLPPGAPGATTTIDGRYLPSPPQPFRG